MQTLSKMAKIPKSKSYWDNAGVVFIQKAITVCDSNWQDRIKTQKNVFSKLLLTSAMNIEKKIQKLPTHCLITCKTKKSNLKISSKSIRTDRKLIKLIRKLIKTDQKLMSSQSLFCLFSSLRKIMHFYKSFLWSQKIILESWKRTRWSPLNN